MPDYRSMYDRDYIGEWDLDGKEVVVTISEVKAAELQNEKKQKSKKPVVYFVGKEKALVLNKTNGKAIAGMYGPKTETWTGKRITLYPSTCEAFGQTVACIRVRPTIPAARGNGPAAKPTVAEAAPGLLAENWTKPTANIDKDLLNDLERGE